METGRLFQVYRKRRRTKNARLSPTKIITSLAVGGKGGAESQQVIGQLMFTLMVRGRWLSAFGMRSFKTPL